MNARVAGQLALLDLATVQPAWQVRESPRARRLTVRRSEYAGIAAAGAPSIASCSAGSVAEKP